MGDDRRKMLEQLQEAKAKREAALTGKNPKPSVEPPLPEDIIADAQPAAKPRPKPSRPPPPPKRSVPPPRPVGQSEYDSDFLDNMSPDALVTLAKTECIKHNVHDEQQLFTKLQPLGLALAKKGCLARLLSLINGQQPDATRMASPGAARRNGARNEMPTRRPPPPPPKNLRAPHHEKEESPESGVYDDTTSVDAEIVNDSQQLKAFIAELKSADLTDKQKHEIAHAKWQEEMKKCRIRFGDEINAIASSAKSKKAPQRTHAENYLKLVLDLRSLADTYGRASKLGSQARKKNSDPPPPSEELKTLDPAFVQSIHTESPQEVPKPAVPDPLAIEIPDERPPTTLKKRGSLRTWLRRRAASPMAWAVATVGAYSAAAHLTGAYSAVTNFLGNLPYVSTAVTAVKTFMAETLHAPQILTNNLDKVVYYGTLLLGLGITHLVWRSQINKDVLKKARRSSLSKDEEQAYNYVVQKLAQVRRSSTDLTLQLLNLRELMIQDENLFDAIDRLYRHEVIWDDIMEDSRLADAVIEELSTVRNQAESEIIKKRLAQIVEYIDHPAHRKIKLKELYRSDPLFQRKVQEIFNKGEDGAYINRDLRGRLTNLKYDKPVPKDKQKRFLLELEEDYDIMMTDSSGIY